MNRLRIEDLRLDNDLTQREVADILNRLYCRID